MTTTNLTDIRLADGTLPAFAFPGGYPLFYLTADGRTVCPACANRDVDHSQRPVACDVHWEGEPVVCEDCGAEVESAYGIPDPDGLDAFLAGYVAVALFASTDDDGESLDGLYSADDVHPETVSAMRADCAAFLRDHADDIGGRFDRAGHDFWLTRNRHGAGFWDGDWAADVGRRLTDAAHVYGSSDLYVGDDGLIHVN